MLIFAFRFAMNCRSDGLASLVLSEKKSRTRYIPTKRIAVFHCCLEMMVEMMVMVVAQGVSKDGGMHSDLCTFRVVALPFVPPLSDAELMRRPLLFHGG